MEIKHLEAQAITRGPKYHFFGYYDKFQTSANDKLALTLEVDFMDRAPTAKDTAGICVIDLASGKSERIAETQAWCWQQSCMLQWLPSAPMRKIIFNVRRDTRFVACVMDIHSGEKRFYERPIYTVSPDGKFALCPNFSRLAVSRPGYGYEGVPDRWENSCCPEDDGIYYLDMETGESRLIISLADVSSLGYTVKYLKQKHWFNHLLISPDSKRFAFLHRWLSPDRLIQRMHQLLTAEIDGSDIRLLNDELTSHFIWKDTQTLLAWANRTEYGDHYYLFKDNDCEDIAKIGEKDLTEDGHMSYRRQGDWFVTDTYPATRDQCRALMLFNETDGRCVEIGRFFAAPEFSGSERCDLHPRWSRDGKSIFFDSLHEGGRQVYCINDVIAKL
jgi:hypothetical protein